MIRRFPREAEVTGNAFSMNRVNKSLRRISKGKKVSAKHRLILCRWYGLEDINKKLAGYLLHSKDGILRFPR